MAQLAEKKMSAGINAPSTQIVASDKKKLQALLQTAVCTNAKGTMARKNSGLAANAYLSAD